MNELAVIPAVAGEVVDNDAVQIGELYQKAGHSLVDSVKYLIECGQHLAERKGSMMHGEWLPWLKHNAAVLGFGHRNTAQKLMKLANAPPAGHLGEAEALQISRQMWGHDKNIALKWTGDPESYTPAIYIKAAREVMGGIDLDPASNMHAQDVVQATEWYDEVENGLLQEWRGRVFLNPPYAFPAVEHFTEKLCLEVEAGNVTQAILLTNNNTDTKWWHRAFTLAEAVCFTKGRVNFYKADGSETQPTNGQTFFYFGAKGDAFREVFGQFGVI